MGAGWRIVFLVFLCSNSFFVTGQNSAVQNHGVPFIRNYPPSEYSAHNQNWAIVQDRRGVMYCGNNLGILEYDGVTWRLIETKNKAIIRSLAIATDGTIYAGSYGDIGYLKSNESHQLQYVSLLSKIKEQYRDFADVWQTIATTRGIYFVTQKFIFRWDGTRMNVWNASSYFHVGFNVNDIFYVRQKDVGLMQIITDSLVLAPLGAAFMNERIMTMTSIGDPAKDEILLGTRNNGLLLYDGRSIKPFKTEADEILKSGQVYCHAKLNNGQHAFGTIQNGVIIIDSLGAIRHHLNKQTGLQDETIWYLFPDREGGLWIGMHLGISRVETNSPFTFFSEREGLEGSALHIARHKDRLYVASSMGVYYLNEKHTPDATSLFRRVTNVSPQCWSLMPFGDVLLAAAFDGVYVISGTNGRIVDSTYAMTLHRSKKDINRVFVGLQGGLKSLYFNKGQWIDEGRIPGIDDEIIQIEETTDYKLWLTARYNGILQIDFKQANKLIPEITRYDTTHGLPAGERTTAFHSAQGLRFATGNGIYSFDEEAKKFKRDFATIKGLPEEFEIYSVSADKNGNLWIIAKGTLGIASLQKDNTYQWKAGSFERVAEIDDYFAYPDPSFPGVTWIGNVDRVIRYSAHEDDKSSHNTKTLIRQATINGDSLLYGGGSNVVTTLSLNHGYKSLRFLFASPGFDSESSTVYQYILEGYDATWSDWSTETYKDYTGLPHGTYKFLVRGKNIYGEIAEPATVVFKIRAPFYLTWWAVLLYLMIFSAAVYALWRFKMKRIQEQHSNALKQLEYDKLKELDQLKSKFFADISHEFRTPLTLILGPIDDLLSGNPRIEEARQYNVIKRNARRLLKLINQLLDLSKLEAGRMDLAFRNIDIVPLVKGISHSFESLIQNKRMTLHVNSNIESAVLRLDVDKMEQIFTNLIGNAVKFTPEGGSVSIEVFHNEAENVIQIDVADTGFGIASDQLPHIFDRFYQGTEADRIHETGSGIGLALTKELVELHKGTINVSSDSGSGTKFSLWLPYINQNYKSETISSRFGIPAQHEYSDIQSGNGSGEGGEDHFENTLLLVEDNPDMRSFVRATLSGNYKIIEAVDGQSGVDKALELVPDIIVSDVMMPHKDGLQLCEILKGDIRTSHIPIILLTAKADIDSKLAGLERGADDYLAKPFNREELLLRTQNLLATRQRFRARYASLSSEITPAEAPEIQVEDEFLKKVRGTVELNISDSELEIDAVAKAIGMSRSQMFRKIKALTGLSPSVYIRGIRLQRGKELLESTEMNVSEVAYQVGFSSPTYFSDAFNDAFGFRPSHIRK